MSDPQKFSLLTSEYSHLDSVHSQLLQAIASSDDNAFAAATAALKQSAQIFTSDEALLKSIVADVNTAASIVNDVAAAAKFIATL